MMGLVKTQKADTVTRVMPELKSSPTLDSDLDHFIREEFKHGFTWLQIERSGFLVFPLCSVEKWVVNFSPAKVNMVLF